jgi:PAS domain S-box-containing protein
MTVFPKSLIASQASDVAWLILGLGVAALMVELVLLSNVLRGLVGMPLRALADAADRLGKDPGGTLELVSGELTRKDELGRLARAFHGMVEQLQARHHELARLNDALAGELAQRRRTERELARHRELNALLDTINYGVLFVDRDLNSRLVNTAYKRMWRTPPDFYATSRNLREDMEQSRGQGLYAVSEAEWPAYRERRLEAIRGGDVGPEEIRFADGRVLTYQCTALADGGRMLTYFDITEMKRAEAALRVHLDGMEASMDGMALADRDGRYTYVNRAHADIYGFRREDMLGRSWREVYDERELRQFETSILPALRTGGRWRGETIGRRRSGSRFPQELSLAVTETGGIVSVVRDITERRNRERALTRALRQAEDANAAKSRFLASMSHELRTPLNAIIGFSRIVHRKTADQIEARQRDNLAKIQTSGEQLLRLINDVLDLSKIEAGRTEVVNAPYAPALLAVECARTIEPMLADGVRLVTDTTGVTEGAVGDAAKVRQILTNLLSNAARHTVRGHVRVAVTVHAAQLRYDVEDTGCGIPPEAREVIFEEFAQARTAEGEVAGGTGLGLTISRRLARLMGGDVTLVSQPGRGSTFTLELPWQPVGTAERPSGTAAREAVGDD